MIIDAPTALYLPLLPKSFNDSGNFTFTISSNDPVLPTTSGSPLLLGGLRIPIPPRHLTYDERKTALGDFIFSVSSGSAINVGSSKKSYEVGQVLEFTESDDLSVLNQEEVPDIIDIQHNTNVLDLSAAGLSDDEIDEINNSARLEFDKLTNELNALKTKIIKDKLNITENEKNFNEVKKIRMSVEVLGNTVIVGKLKVKELELSNQKTELINIYNDDVALSSVKYGRLIELKEIVR